jgi:hypothetical protein
MQGAARMVLQTGMHPAAIKDSVTSESLKMLLFLIHDLTFLLRLSTRWMYYCRADDS